MVGKKWKLKQKGEGWVLNCFFLSFSNHENYSIKNICVYSKSKIKTKVTSKQNLEYFKMINRRLFIHKFCNNSKMLLSSSWAIFIRALVFSSSPRANFSSFEYLCFSSSPRANFSSFEFILIYYTRLKTEKLLHYHKDWKVSIILYYLFWYNKTQSRSFLIQLETTMQSSEILAKENLWWKILGEILEGFFVTVQI